MSKKVKTILHYNVNRHLFQKMDEGDLQTYLTQREEIDPEGRLTKEVKYNAQGREEEITEISYDQNGQELERMAHFVMEGHTDRLVTEKDPITGTTEEIKYYGDEPGERRLLKYNDDDLLLEEVSFDEEGQQDYRKSFQYDENGQCVMDEEYDHNDQLIQQVRTEYADGRMIHQYYHFPLQDEEDYQISISTSPEGHEIQTGKDEHGNILLHKETHFDEKGRIIYIREENSLQPEMNGITEEYYEDDLPVSYKRTSLDGTLLYSENRQFEDKRPVKLHRIISPAGGGGIARDYLIIFRYEFY